MSIHREEYCALRAEIVQSIAQQHHILLGGYGAAAAALGLIFGSGTQSTFGIKAIFVVPTILTAMVALWAVECNRMVRASYYIAKSLWPLLSDDKGAHSGWENWIRTSSGVEGRFRKRQDTLQRIVVLHLPFGLTVVGFILSLSHSEGEYIWFVSVLAIGFINLFIWAYLYKEIPRISDLAAEVDEPPKGQPLKAKGD